MQLNAIQPSINGENGAAETEGNDDIKADIVERVRDPNTRNKRHAKVSFKSMPSYDALTVDQVLGDEIKARPDALRDDFNLRII